MLFLRFGKEENESFRATCARGTKLRENRTFPLADTFLPILAYLSLSGTAVLNGKIM
jgi:hypothetical protein